LFGVTLKRSNYHSITMETSRLGLRSAPSRRRLGGLGQFVEILQFFLSKVRILGKFDLCIC